MKCGIILAQPNFNAGGHASTITNNDIGLRPSDAGEWLPTCLHNRTTALSMSSIDGWYRSLIPYIRRGPCLHGHQHIVRFEDHRISRILIGQYWQCLLLYYPYPQLEARFLEQSSTNLYCILEREISCTTANSRAYLRIIYEHHKSISKPLLVVAVHPPGNGKLTSIYRTSDEQFTGEIVRLKKISFQSVASATCVENNLRTKYNISLKSL